MSSNPKGFGPKMEENEKKWTNGGGLHPKFVYVDSPLKGVDLRWDTPIFEAATNYLLRIYSQLPFT